MQEDKKNRDGSNLASLLDEREKLDELLRAQHTRKVAIFFSDLKGYTSFTETRGDLASRSYIKRANDIAFPSLEEHGGRLVKTIGDAIMASFSDPVAAVKFAIDVQRKIKAANTKFPPADQINMKMGLHFGEAIIDDDGDLFGDAVNVAARIEPQSKAGGILISPDLFEAVKGAEDIDCRYAKKVKMKGKSLLMELYQVAWDGGRFDDYSEDEFAGKSAEKGESGIASVSAGNFITAAWLKWGAIAVVLMVLGVGIVNRNIFNREDFNDPYIMGYDALRSKGFEQAEKDFSMLPANDPRYLEAMTALYLWQRDYEKAAKSLPDALERAKDRVYVHVMKGDLSLANMKNEEAVSAYTMALEQEKGLDWQRALAYNGLGRVRVSESDYGKAVDAFSKAVDLAPNNAEILTNFGIALEKTGNNSEAKNMFQQALQVDNSDKIALQKLKMEERREQFELDKKKQESINQLIEDLVAQYTNGSLAEKQLQGEGMSSQAALSIWLVPLEEKGDLPSREGENEVFSDLLAQNLQQSKGVEVVDRTLLDKLLAELKIGSSELADKETSLKLGRLLAARIILNGTIYRRGRECLVTMKAIETETSRIRVAETFEVDSTDRLLLSAGEMASVIRKKLKEIYPQIQVDGESMPSAPVGVNREAFAPPKAADPAAGLNSANHDRVRV